MAQQVEFLHTLSVILKHPTMSVNVASNWVYTFSWKLEKCGSMQHSYICSKAPQKLWDPAHEEKKGNTELMFLHMTWLILLNPPHGGLLCREECWGRAEAQQRGMVTKLGVKEDCSIVKNTNIKLLSGLDQRKLNWILIRINTIEFWTFWEVHLMYSLSGRVDYKVSKQNCVLTWMDLIQELHVFIVSEGSA